MVESPPMPRLEHAGEDRGPAALPSPEMPLPQAAATVRQRIVSLLYGGAAGFLSLAGAETLSAQEPRPGPVAPAAPPRAPAKLPGTVEEWVERHCGGLAGKIEVLVSELNDNDFRKRERAHEELLRLLTSLCYVMNPPPFDLSPYLEGGAKRKSLSAEQRKRIDDIAERIDTLRETLPSRLPPLSGDAGSIIRTLASHSGNSLVLHDPDGSLGRMLRETRFTVDPRRSSFWDILDALRVRAGLRYRCTPDQQLVLSATGESYRFLAPDGPVGLFARYCEPGKEMPPASQRFIICCEPSRGGTLLSVKRAEIAGEGVHHDAELAVWPPRHKAWSSARSYDIHCPSMKRLKSLAGGGSVTDPVVVTADVVRAAGRRTLGMPLGEDGTASSGRIPNRIVRIAVQENKDGRFTLREVHGLWSEIPWPPTSSEFDGYTYLTCLTTMRRVEGKDGAAIPATITHCSTDRRVMSITLQTGQQPSRVLLFPCTHFEPATLRFTIDRELLQKGK